MSLRRRASLLKYVFGTLLLVHVLKGAFRRRLHKPLVIAEMALTAFLVGPLAAELPGERVAYYVFVLAVAVGAILRTIGAPALKRRVGAAELFVQTPIVAALGVAILAVNISVLCGVEDSRGFRIAGIVWGLLFARGLSPLLQIALRGMGFDDRGIAAISLVTVTSPLLTTVLLAPRLTWGALVAAVTVLGALASFGRNLERGLPSTGLVGWSR